MGHARPDGRHLDPVDAELARALEGALAVEVAALQQDGVVLERQLEPRGGARPRPAVVVPTREQ
jgi:hypothetical protein